MSQEKRLQKFDHSWEAQAVAEELRQAGIEARVAARPREYATVLVGGPQDPAELYVQSVDEAAARQVMEKFFRERSISVVSDSNPPPKNDFRAVVIYNLMAVIFPVVFPVLAILPFFRLLNAEASLSKKLFAGLAMSFGVLVSLTVIRMWVRP